MAPTFEETRATMYAKLGITENTTTDDFAAKILAADLVKPSPLTMILAACGGRIGSATKLKSQLLENTTLLDNIKSPTTRARLNLSNLQRNANIQAALLANPHMSLMAFDIDAKTLTHVCDEARDVQLCIERCSNPLGRNGCNLIKAPNCCYCYYMTGRCPNSTPLGKGQTTPLTDDCPARLHCRPWTGLTPTGPDYQPLPNASPFINFAEVLLLLCGKADDGTHPPFTPEGAAPYEKLAHTLGATATRRHKAKEAMIFSVQAMMESRVAYAASRNKPAVRERIMDDARRLQDSVLNALPGARQPELRKRPRDAN